MAASQLSNADIADALKRARELAAGTRTEKPTKRVHDEGEEAENEESSAKKSVMTGNPITALGSVSGMDLVTIEQYKVPDNCVGLTPYHDHTGKAIRNCTLTGTPSAIEKAKSLMESIIAKAGESLPPSRSLSSSSSTGQSVSYSSPGAPAMMPGPSIGAKMITTELLIPGSKCGLVIGKGGETIKSIQEKAGVKMVMIQEDNQVTAAPKPLRIIGEVEKVEYAKRLVDEIMNSKDDRMPMYNEYGSMPGNRSTGEVIVPKSAVGVIIGKNGEAIKRLTQETGAKIQFKLGEDFNAPERTAVITGTRDQIEKATQLITEMVNRAVSGETDVFYMHVPANKTGLVIGKGGETIKQIAAESGARVELSRDPVPNDHEKVFVIKGTLHQIHHASHLIRIRVGDVPAGTPVPPFPNGAVAEQPQFNYPTYNSPNVAPDPNGAAWAAAYYAQYYHQNAPVPYGQPFPSPTTAPVAASQTTAAARSSAVAPAINPQTGQPDYSVQWAEYYRTLGMHEQAAVIEQQARASQQGGHPPPMAAAPAGQAFSFPQAQPQFGYGQQPAPTYQYTQQY